MASLGFTISALITNHDIEMVEFLKRPSHNGQLLADVHHFLSKARRAFIVPNVDKVIKTLLENSETNEFLFGLNVAQKIGEKRAITN